MRTIRFRAWDKTEKEMQVVTDIFFNKKTGVLKSFLTKGSKATYHTNLDYHELMQHTGLKDINGVEIYEGDIIKEQANNNDYIYVEVVFENGVFMGKENRFEPEYPVHDFLNGWIIGNIYENKNLLEEST